MQTVLVIYKFFARGGAQRDLIRTAEALLARKVKVLVLCAEAGDPLPDGCQLQLLPVGGWSNHSRMKKFERKAAKFLQQNPADVVVGFGRMRHLDIYFAADDCLRSRWKNAFLNCLLPRRRTFLELERSAVASPLVLTLTARQEQDYRKFYQLDPACCRRMPPGIDRKYQLFDRSESRRSELRKKYRIAEDKFLLVQAAASFATKGVDRSLAILDTLPPELRSSVTLLVAGDDKHRNRYLRLAEMLKLDVRFPGGIDTLEDVYLAADLMIHPARNEAAGMVLTEALCSNLPVLTSELCGYAEYITASGGGVVLPEPFKLEHWSLALQKLLKEPEHLQQCRKNIAGLYKNDFWYSRPEVMAGEIIDFARNKGSI